jgi:glycosyltransferase involved in cell wall biosynthesis
VGDGGVLYEDESATGLAEALEKILSDRALYDKKREAAQRMAEERYSDEVCAKALVELYEKVIK